MLKSNTSILSKGTSLIDSPPSSSSSSSSKSLLLPITSSSHSLVAKTTDNTNRINHSTSSNVNDIDKHLENIKIDKPTANLLNDPAVRDFLLRGSSQTPKTSTNNSDSDNFSESENKSG